MKSKTQTQLEVVIKKLERDGYVDNLWAIRNYILRLGAIIHVLRKEYGLNIRTDYKNVRGHRNCHYYWE